MSDRKSLLSVLYDISEDLSTEDCRGLSFLADMSTTALTHCCCKLHGRVGALGLLEKMRDRGVYSNADLGPLAALLREVGRYDLAARCSAAPALPVPLKRQVSVSDVEPDKCRPDSDTHNSPTPSPSGQKYTHYAGSNEIGPSSWEDDSSLSLPQRCKNPLSFSTSRLFSFGGWRKTRRQRPPMVVSQSCDHSFIVVDKRELVGYIGPGPTPSSPDHTPSSPSDEDEGPECWYGGGSKRDRSHTTPDEPSSGIAALSPTHSLPPSALSSPAHPLPASAISPSLLPSNCPEGFFGSTPSTSASFTWLLKRKDFLSPIFEHTNKSLDKRYRLRAGRGTGCGLTLDLRLYPNGLNWAMDNHISLQVEVTTPTSHSSRTLYFSVMVVEKGLPHVLASRKKVCRLREEKGFLLEQFISHDVVKVSTAKMFKISLDINLSYCLGEDWVCI